MKPGICRTIFGFATSQTASKRWSLGGSLMGLVGRVPHWLLDLHSLGDQDVVIMHTQVILVVYIK